MAAVCLAPSGPDRVHSVANWVIVFLLAWDRAADNGQDGGAVVWSAPGSWPEREDQLGLRLPFVCVEPNF